MSEFATNVNTGVLGVDDVLQSKHVRDVTPGLYDVYPDNMLTPLLATSSMIGFGRPAFAPKIEFHSKGLYPAYDTVDGTPSTASGATVVFDVDNVDRFKVGDVIEFPAMAISSTVTNQAYITAISASEITAKAVGFQADNSTLKTVGTVADGAKINILSDSSDENSLAPDARVAQATNNFNWIQFLRRPYVIGNIQQGHKNYTGDERSERRAETMREIKLAFERQLLFGERFTANGTEGKKHFMGGFKREIERAAGSNILDWSGGLTEAQWDAWLLGGPLRVGSGERTMVCSDSLFLQILGFAKSKERVIGQSDAYGLNVTRYRGPNGKIINLVHHHLLNETAGYAGAGILVDQAYAKLRPYSDNGFLQFHSDIQENDRAGVKDEWRILGTLEIGLANPHGYIHV